MHKLIRGKVEVLQGVHTTSPGTERKVTMNTWYVVCTDGALMVMIVLEENSRGGYRSGGREA